MTSFLRAAPSLLLNGVDDDDDAHSIVFLQIIEEKKAVSIVNCLWMATLLRLYWVMTLF